MTAQSFLNNMSRLESDIKSKVKRLEALRLLQPGNLTANLTGMPHSQNCELSLDADLIYKIIDLENEIREERKKLSDIKIELLDRIGMIPDVEQQMVLIDYYLQGHTWKDIADAMNVSDRWVYKLRKKALEALTHVFETVQ